MAADDNRELSLRLRTLFATFDTDPEATLRQLSELYDEHVYFQDPIQSLTGLTELVEMFRRMVRRARQLRFEVLDAATEGEHLFFTWKMYFTPRAGVPLTFEGTTHARVRLGKVVYQRDYWDLLGSMADSMPFVAPVYRSLVAKLG